MAAPAPSSAELNVLAGIYGKAARDLAGLLGSTAFQRGKASILLRQVDQISRRLGLQSDRWVGSRIDDIADKSAVAVFRDLDRAGVELGDGSATMRADFLRVNEGAVSTIARQMARDLAGANKSIADAGRRIIRKTSQLVLKDHQVSEIIAKGLISGGSVRKIAAGLRARLAEGGRELLASGKMTAKQLEDIADFAGGYIQAGSRRMDIREYCWMVADSQLREAVTAATVDRLTAAGEELGDPDLLDLVQVMGITDGCPVCDGLVGNIYSISGRSSEYPDLGEISGGPPFHPNCTHSLAPYIAGGRDKGRRGGQEPTGKRYVTASEARGRPSRGRDEPIPIALMDAEGKILKRLVGKD